jgi:hypothetical protein
MVSLTSNGPTVEQIVAWAEQRAQSQGLWIAQMRKFKDVYNGDIILPMPEVDASEEVAVANILMQGLDQLAGRVTSATPNLFYPPLRPGIQQSEDRARVRTLATLGWWETNRMDIKLRRRARHLIGLGATPVIVSPDSKKQCPRWEFRDPMNTFPAETGDPDEITPPDVIFKFPRTWGWLKAYYPVEIRALNTGSGQEEPHPNTKFDIIEYVDADVRVLAVLGAPTQGQGWFVNGRSFVELERTPNRAGICLAVTPGRITLDRRQGQFDQSIGMFKTQARLMSLELIAAERAVFPTMLLEPNQPGADPMFVDGPYDGRTGKVNIVRNGQFREVLTPSNQMTQQIGDRLERGMRVTSGLSPELGGESQSNVRTGKRGDSIMSAVLDQPVAEAQQMLAASLEAENRIAVAIAKNYWGNEKKSFYVSKYKTHAQYTASTDFEDDRNIVNYPMMGADSNAQTIMIGQLRGLGMLSAHTAMEISPLIDDPILEKRRVDAEALREALKAGITAQAQSAQIAPHDVARMIQLVLAGKEIEEAVDQVQQEAQQRQATAAPAPDESQGQVTSPEAQPGLAQPGVGAEQPTTVAAPSASSANLVDLLRGLHTTSQNPARGVA